ncbi:hypothetical protein ABEF95_006595 [Exophiala dermatitidis]|nr:RNA polymerase II C-terminal domain kinase beta subunit [Exophiala dermatitidis]KAJ4584256.1 RNA polymerase II C-terminal domain kinase beta subunit [Exophiala dermatitidis]KAJ4610754.1 RNA polymerase II C-terminal domain kinase beta subunit [Exophiala dermatitidis]KAJ9004343.1 RNA polymerase II C-terminal domain kinase beta subunit [Exophiala dermatitidis]
MNGAGSGETNTGTGRRRGPLPNFVQVAKSYVFEQEIQTCLRNTGVSQAREDSIRLAGVQWIDNVRRALKLPVKTFNTAAVYYHKFRLQHSDGEYSFVDAAAAALFTACKIEDTLKKSRDILCAAHNIKVPRKEHLSPDDQVFEHQSRTIIGLERLMLEASGFDFRNRHPQEFLIKLAKFYNYEKTSRVVKTAYVMSLDLYRTFAPLKQQTATMAFACLELAGRLLGEENMDLWRGKDYATWRIDRGMVMETLLDLLELYTHHRTMTSIGPDFPVDRFLEVRIPLNVESEEKRLPRYTEWIGTSPEDASLGLLGQAGGLNGAPGRGGLNGSHSRGSSKNVSPKDANVTSPNSTNSSSGAGIPGSGSTAATSLSLPGGAGGVRQRAGERGREGSVRFILNPDRERDERAIVEMYRGS